MEWYEIEMEEVVVDAGDLSLWERVGVHYFVNVTTGAGITIEEHEPVPDFRRITDEEHRELVDLLVCGDPADWMRVLTAPCGACGCSVEFPASQTSGIAPCPCGEGADIAHAYEHAGWCPRCGFDQHDAAEWTAERAA